VRVDDRMELWLKRTSAVPVVVRTDADTFNVTNYAGGVFADEQWSETWDYCNKTVATLADVLRRKCNPTDTILAARAYHNARCRADSDDGFPVLACGEPAVFNCTVQSVAVRAWLRCAPCSAADSPKLLSVAPHPDAAFFQPTVWRQWDMLE
jgi:hypothetical protein